MLRVDSDVLTDLFHLQFSKYLNVAALAVFAFDYCLTFSTEVEYVWCTKWGVTRIVFTLSRYLPFISSSLTCYEVLVNPKCGSFVTISDVTYGTSIIFADVILILRTYALWGRNKRVVIFLLLLAGAFLATAEVLSRLVTISLPGDSTSFYQFYPFMCTHGSSRGATLEYTFLMGYEIILQSMHSWRKLRTYRNIRSGILNTMYWDGIMYMWWIIVLSAANMIVGVAAPITYVPALYTAQVATHSVLASRIFFNLVQCDRRMMFFGDEAPLETLRFRAGSAVPLTTHAETIDIA